MHNSNGLCFENLFTKIFSEHWAKYIFARAINSPCKKFCESTGEGEGDHPR